jgi:hypothetical protein
MKKSITQQLQALKVTPHPFDKNVFCCQTPGHGACEISPISIKK